MKKTDNLIKFLVFALSTLVISITLFLFVYIFYKGFDVITPTFIFDRPKGLPLGMEGGIFPAIVGTLLLGMISGIIASLFALCIAIYISFYSSQTFAKIINALLFFMSSFPSVIFGLVFYTILIYKLAFVRSLLTASITIGIMIVPFIAIRVLQILRDEDKNFFLTALSLGYSKTHIVFCIVFKKNLGAITNAIFLAISYGIGVTAPIIYTGAVINAGIPNSINAPFMALPYHLYMLIIDNTSIDNAYGTAFVLLVIVLIINYVPRQIQNLNHWRKNHE